MNTPHTLRTRHKKHAGRPSTASVKSPTAFSIALIRNSAIGLGCSLGGALLFLLCATFIAYHSTDPNILLQPLAYITLCFSGFLAGASTVRLHGGAPLVCGAIAGILLLLTCCLIHVLLPTAEAFCNPPMIPIRIFVVPLAIIGAYLMQKRPKRSYRRHR